MIVFETLITPPTPPPRHWPVRALAMQYGSSARRGLGRAASVSDFAQLAFIF